MSASSLVLSSLLSLPSTVHLPATVQSVQHPINTDETSTQEHSNANFYNHYYHYYYRYYCPCLLLSFFWDTLYFPKYVFLTHKWSFEMCQFQGQFAETKVQKQFQKMTAHQTSSLKSYIRPPKRISSLRRSCGFCNFS